MTLADANAHELLHGQESEVFADTGHTEVRKRPEIIEAQEAGEIAEDVQWHVAEERGKVTAMPENPLKDLVKQIEYMTAQIRAGSPRARRLALQVS